MAAASRLLRTCTALQLDSSLPSPSPSSSSSSPSTASNNALRCRGTAKISSEKVVFGNGGGSKPTVVLKASAAFSESSVLEGQKTNKGGGGGGVDVALLVAEVADSVRRIFRPVVKRKTWQLQAQMFIERGIINCRFFILMAVAGSLLGSILCFVEGCFLVLASFFEYFQTTGQRSDHGEMVHLLIEALDSFLVGTGMLIFGMGMYVSFVGLKETKSEKGWLVPQSSLFGLFPLKRLPSWVEMQCVSQAKLKIGHSVVLLLQAGLVEKFQNVPMANGVDLACFAGAILVSSACVFLLSRISMK